MEKIGERNREGQEIEEKYVGGMRNRGSPYEFSLWERKNSLSTKGMTLAKVHREGGDRTGRDHLQWIGKAPMNPRVTTSIKGGCHSPSYRFSPINVPEQRKNRKNKWSRD